MKVFGIASPYTGSGKTLATLGFLSAIPGSISFKIGPDYIDGQLHSAVSGHRALNIDRWIQGRSYSLVLKRNSSYSAGIVEGVMGLYDSGSHMDLSTIYYFKKLGIRYILVVDAEKTAESTYYIAKGFLTKLCIGVIINNYYGEGHLRMVTKTFLDHGVRIIGSIPHDNDLAIKERHLGLVNSIPESRIREIGSKVSGYLDTSFLEEINETESLRNNEDQHDGRYRIYVAMDDAFSFYYQSSINFLSRLGSVTYFSPLRGEIPDNPDFIYIGGGYPEIYASRLSSQKTLRRRMKSFSEEGVPIMAECGGLMYLESKLQDGESAYEMCGIFPGKAIMSKKLTIGYTKLRAVNGNPIFRDGEIVYGHEFHYSTIDDDHQKSFITINGHGINGMDGITANRTIGSYSHIDLERYGRRIKDFVKG